MGMSGGGYSLSEGGLPRKERAAHFMPAWYRRDIGKEKEKIFLGEPWYHAPAAAWELNNMCTMSEPLRTHAVVAFTEWEAELLITHFCIERHRGWNVLWHVQAIRPREISFSDLDLLEKNTLPEIEEGGDIELINIPNMYYHIALGQALLDKEKTQK